MRLPQRAKRLAAGRAKDGEMMEKETRVLELDAYEYSVVLNALANYRNDALAKGRTTDLIDEVLLKAIAAPSKGKVRCKSRKGRPR